MIDIIILASEPGGGKTYHAEGWEDPILLWDAENPRAQDTKDTWYPEKMITIVPLLQRVNHKRDYYQSYLTLKKNVDELLKLKSVDFLTIVVDGISDIRNKYAKAKWFHDHPNRKNPMPEEYTEINGTTNGLLEPLIDMANDCGFNLILTAQFCDRYGEVEKFENGKKIISSEKLGREPNYEDWQAYGVNTVIELVYQKPNYKAICTKSIMGCWEETITDKNLFDVLKNKGI